MKNKYLAIVPLTALLALILNSCDSIVGRSAAIGAGIGALAHGGHHGGHRAVHAAAAGALIGALIGTAISEEEARRRYPPPAEGYPFGRPTETPGFVRSPYRPHRTVDVRGIPPGELVRDPASGGVFVNP